MPETDTTQGAEGMEPQPVIPRGEPGSYQRGHDNGWNAALKASRRTHSPPGGVTSGGDAKIEAAAQALAKPSCGEREPGLGWKLSDEARADIENMERQNARNVAALGNVRVGSSSPPAPARRSGS